MTTDDTQSEAAVLLTAEMAHWILIEGTWESGKQEAAIRAIQDGRTVCIDARELDKAIHCLRGETNEIIPSIRMLCAVLAKLEGLRGHK